MGEEVFRETSTSFMQGGWGILKEFNKLPAGTFAETALEDHAVGLVGSAI